MSSRAVPAAPALVAAAAEPRSASSIQANFGVSSGGACRPGPRDATGSLWMTDRPFDWTGQGPPHREAESAKTL